MKKIIGLFILCFFIFAYFGNIVSNNSLSNLSSAEVTIHVKGEVLEEKDVILPKYSTFGDLLKHIELSEKADISIFSEKQVLHNQDIINIPVKSDNRISINNASLDDLQKIPSVGVATASNIIDYRTNHGLFNKLEDLMNVKGIKEKKFQKIRDYLKI